MHRFLNKNALSIAPRNVKKDFPESSILNQDIFKN